MSSGARPRIVLGISSCLLGQRVRYDGGTRRDAYIVDMLAPYVEFVPVCPEVESGMGVPRPPVQLVGNPTQPRMLGVADASVDFTARMLHFGATVWPRIAHVSGYIFKSRSPSCGVVDTPIVAADGNVRAYGAGLFTRSIRGHAPNLPLQDERALHAPEVRDHFFEQVFSYRRWQTQVAHASTLMALREFHVAHKYSLMAHQQEGYRILGQMLARATLSPACIARYMAHFFETLRKPATRASHVNVLQHLIGYFKKSATVVERHRVLGLMSSYHEGMVTLDAVQQEICRLNARYPNAYLFKQNYLYPEVDDVLLRARVSTCMVKSDSQTGSTSAASGSL